MTKKCPLMGGKACAESDCMFWGGETSHRLGGMVVANEPECLIVKSLLLKK
jgi:hypothetical protein